MIESDAIETVKRMWNQEIEDNVYYGSIDKLTACSLKKQLTKIIYIFALRHLETAVALAPIIIRIFPPELYLFIYV